MMATIGRLSEFVPGNESDVAVLLSAIVGKTCGLLRNLVVPSAPKNTYQDLINALMKQFEPKPLLIAECFYFHRRYQHAGETVADFSAELTRLTAKCKFKEPLLDEVLRNRFVCGLKSEAAQNRLLTEKDLTFAKAVEIAPNQELAAANTSQLKSHTRAGGSPPEESF